MISTDNDGALEIVPDMRLITQSEYDAYQQYKSMRSEMELAVAQVIDNEYPGNQEKAFHTAHRCVDRIMRMFR